jgi:hypothetical protein
MGKRKVYLSDAELLSVGAACIWTATNETTAGESSNKAKFLELRTRAIDILKTTPVSATQLKDLGLDLIGRSVDG